MKIIDTAIKAKAHLKENASKYGQAAWQIAKSEQAIGVIKIVGAGVALIHAVDEYKKSKRKIGFQ